MPGRDDPKHEMFKRMMSLYRDTRGLPLDPRDSAANIERAKSKLTTNRLLEKRNPPQALSDADIEAWVKQFDDVSDNIRKMIVGDVDGEGLSSPREIHDERVKQEPPRGGYMAFEWKVKFMAHEPAENGCGCGCGCGCGG